MASAPYVSALSAAPVLARVLALAVAVLAGCSSPGDSPAPSGHRATSASSTEAPPAGTAPRAQVAVSERERKPDRWGFLEQLERPIDAPDLEHVDVVAIYPQVAALAERLQPGAQLIEAHVNDAAPGTVDARGDTRASFAFAFAGVDPAARIGAEKYGRMVRIAIRHAQLQGTVRDDNLAVDRLVDRGHPRYGALPAPTCPLVKLFEHAVASGVPRDAVMSLDYLNERALMPKTPFVWALHVKDHSELSRRIDAASCAVVEKR